MLDKAQLEKVIFDYKVCMTIVFRMSVPEGSFW